MAKKNLSAIQFVITEQASICEPYSKVGGHLQSSSVRMEKNTQFSDTTFTPPVVSEQVSRIQRLVTTLVPTSLFSIAANENKSWPPRGPVTS